MNVDSIQNGIVIDHITAGKSMLLYDMLGLDSLDVSVAIMKNVPSQKMGRKYIIKIDADIDIDLDVIGFVDPGATVNIIRSGSRIRKFTIPMPDTLINVIRCKNPRCITSVEQELKQIFVLTDRNKGIYRCRYCETRYELNK